MSPLRIKTTAFLEMSRFRAKAAVESQEVDRYQNKYIIFLGLFIVCLPAVFILGFLGRGLVFGFFLVWFGFLRQGFSVALESVLKLTL